tara:strand:- start:31 stop:1086 length:1056 start_codon:yes stop_codon:yes gene_type:complete
MENYKLLLDKIKVVALDMDGVMRIGKRPIHGIHSLLEKIKTKGLKAMVVTNECRYTEGKIRHDFYDMKIKWLDEWSIYTSANSVTDFLVKTIQKKSFLGGSHPNKISLEAVFSDDEVLTPRTKSSVKSGITRNRSSSGVDLVRSMSRSKLYDEFDEPNVTGYIGVVGEKGLKEAVKDAIRRIADKKIHVEMANLPPFESGDYQLYLVIGTLYNLDIADLEKALKWIKSGAKVIISCPDTVDPELKGDFSICMPRHILHMVRLNAQTDYYCVGKPNALMARAISNIFREDNVNMDEILFVGDSLNTDIKLAEENGMVSALVLTGNTTLRDLEKSCVQPDMVFRTLEQLADIL